MVLWVFAPAHITTPAEPGGIGKPACAVPPGTPPFNSNPHLLCRKAGKPALRKRSAGFPAFFCLFLREAASWQQSALHAIRAVRFVQRVGVQPQSATSRLPIQRKGEREIAESCYVRMIPRGLYRRSRHPGVRNCEGAKSINIHVNYFLIKFWASIFRKA